MRISFVAHDLKECTLYTANGQTWSETRKRTVYFWEFANLISLIRYRTQSLSLSHLLKHTWDAHMSLSAIACVLHQARRPKLLKTMVWTRFSFIHRTLLNACSNNQLQHCTKPIITYLLNDLNTILNYTILYMAHHTHKNRNKNKNRKREREEKSGTRNTKCVQENGSNKSNNNNNSQIHWRLSSALFSVFVHLNLRMVLNRHDETLQPS